MHSLRTIFAGIVAIVATSYITFTHNLPDQTFYLALQRPFPECGHVYDFECLGLGEMSVEGVIDEKDVIDAASFIAYDAGGFVDDRCRPLEIYSPAPLREIPGIIRGLDNDGDGTITSQEMDSIDHRCF